MITQSLHTGSLLSLRLLAIVAFSLMLIVLPPNHEAAADTFTVAGFTFDDTLGPTNVVPVAPNTISTFEAFAFSAQFIPLSNQGNDFDVNLTAGIQLLGSQPGQNVGGTSIELGDNSFRGTVELNWGGNPGVTNNAGDDFVVYENGAPNGPEAYMIAVRETGATTFSMFRYEFADDVVRVLPSEEVDIAQVLSTGFDLSDFGIAEGGSIDAIWAANLIPADRVDEEIGQGFVTLGGGSGFAPRTGPQGSGGTFNSNGFDADLTYIGVIVPDESDTDGDFDVDGDVDGTDFLTWQRGGSPTPRSTSDLSEWQQAYGIGSTLRAIAVPEPSTLALILMMLITAPSRRTSPHVCA